MYHFPDYVLAIHADRLRAAEAARRSKPRLARQEPRPLVLRRPVRRPSRSRAPPLHRCTHKIPR
jgi:hypothetical protein